MNNTAGHDRSTKNQKVLGELAAWGAVGYTGRAFAPAASTYEGIDPASLNYTHRADSGEHPTVRSPRGALANLVPLMLAAQWESGFAREAGPLSTWSN
jgi:hypothetical protein